MPRFFFPQPLFAPSIWIVMSLLNEHLNRDNSSALLALRYRSPSQKKKQKKKKKADNTLQIKLPSQMKHRTPLHLPMIQSSQKISKVMLSEK